MRIYLNTSAWQSPFDDLSAERVRVEAEESRAALLVTTDDRMLKVARRSASQLRVRVVGPIEALEIVLSETTP